MPLSALLTNLIPDDANPMGTDFVGGADLSGQALTGSSHLANAGRWHRRAVRVQP